jgi:Lon protease-like protein
MPRLPLFPLNLALFPGTQAPLHIFEDRYRALLRDVLAADAAFGIVLPREDGIPPAGAIGVCARILTHQPLPDGRSNVLIQGDQRFLLRTLLDDGTPYLTGDVEYFDDVIETHPVEPDLVRQLRALAERCRKAMATLSDLPVESGWSTDVAAFTFQVASGMPWEPAQAQPILAMRRASERVAALLRALPGIVPELEQRAAVHHRAGRNGKGPHSPAVPA